MPQLTVERAIEILDPTHREHYDSIDVVNEACKMGMEALALKKTMTQRIAELEAEIERLQKTGEEAVSCFTRMESLYKIKCKELEVAKSEAYREFAERLKNKATTKYDWNDYIEVEDINNALKELTESNE